MYQAVTFSLLGLTVSSVVFSLIGFVRFDWLALTTSAVVLVVASVATNACASYLRGKGMRHESAVITGLILYFLLAPATSLEGYISLVFLAAIAIASKYLLVFRGRHIFNPAAVSVVIAPLIGLSAALWWVATPALSIVVLLAGTFLLYRLGRLVVGYTYVIVALLVTVLVTSISGSFAVTDVLLFLGSYPLLFLAFYMLTEPLTQAPRHAHRVAIAAGIAVLASLQISILGYFIAPEVALLIGNIVAFFLSQKGAISLSFHHQEKLAAGYAAYYFVPARSYNFLPGQYLELTLFHKKPDAKGQRRMFTIASPPNSELMRLIVRHGDQDSTYKTALAALKEGQKVEATGIYGDFILPESGQKLLLVAGGIGITPFLSQLASPSFATSKHDVTVLYFVRNASDAVAIDEIRATRNIKIVVIDEIITSELVARHVPDAHERTAYVSGPPRMVDAAKSTLTELGIKRITTDQFDGY